MRLDTTKPPFDEGHGSTDLDEAMRLCKLIGDHKYGITRSVSTIDGREWVELAVRIPVGTPRGIRTRFIAIRMFWKIMNGAI